MSRTVTIVRLYDALTPEKGDTAYRVFIDRLWPRGVAKKDFVFDQWCKDLAPSQELRQWFGHKASRWETFSKRYRDELQTREQQDRLADLVKQAGDHSIVLLYGAKDTTHNHAIVLAQALRTALKHK